MANILAAIGRCPRCGYKLRYAQRTSRAAGKKIYMCTNLKCEYVKVKN